MRRVVVTGMGAVTPIGNDVPTYWENLKAGKCGVGPLTKFDCTDYKASLAAEVQDFDPTLYLDKGEVRKTDLFTQYAIASAVQAVKDSGAVAIFAENSNNSKSIEAIARGAGVTPIVGDDALYGDSLGPDGSEGATYVGSIIHNTRAVTQAWGGTVPALPERLETR